MSIKKIIFDGLKNYKKIFNEIILLSLVLGIYMNLFKIYDYSTRFLDKTTNLYLLSIIVVIAIFIPYYYLYISLFTAYASIIKKEIDNQPYKFKNTFLEEKFKSLRVFFVLIIQSIIKIIIAILFIFLVSVKFDKFTILYILGLICLSVFYIRIDLALSIIYWDIDELNEFSQKKQSFLKDILISRYITRTDFIKKAIIILIANIPNIVIDILNLYSSINFINNNRIGILSILFIILFTIITRPFKLSIYHSLYKQLNLLPFADKLIDKDGNEWTAY